MTTARHIIIALLLILAQGAIDNYVNLSVYLDLSLCIYILLTLPPHWGAIPSMATGFILGLTVDVLGNGIPGMTAAAMTATGVFRRSIFNLTAPKEKEKRQNFEAIGLRNFLLYSLPLILIFLTVYILLDSSGFRPAGQCLARLGISLAANTALTAFLYTASNDSRRKQ